MNTSKPRDAESLLGQIADEYTERLERGERPDVEEYAQRYPELSAVIRQVFPALQVMNPRSSAADSSIPLAPPMPELQAEALGDYRIIREIGRGGMGIVYEAEQQSLRRRVALKVLPFAAVLDSRQLQRFKNEAQAAANLHHTNIVPVFSLGCERGVHYYAMQYIEGQPLSAVIEELRRLVGPAGPAPRGPGAGVSPITDSLASGRWAPPVRPESVRPAQGAPNGASPGSSNITLSVPTKGFTASLEGASPSGSVHEWPFFRAVANLGIQAAEALAYAHEHGVIHRDIKPSNLLVDAEGHLWITDFGLAQMQTHPGLTVPGDLLGTLRYMSPEQALAKRVPIDPRSDVYSLGVTLYELLCLQPAFDGGDRQELMRQIAFEDPRPLRRVDRQIPRELDTIIGKATAKRPDDRYTTAQELADDLRRFLEDKPILAKAPSLLDCVLKWSRRHSSLVAASIAFLALAVVVLSISTWSVLSSARMARDQQQRAEANLRLARSNVDRMLNWVQMQELSGPPHLLRLRQDFLEESLAFYLSLLPEKLNDPVACLDAGQAYLQAGRIKGLLGQENESQAAFGEGIRILKQLTAAYPDTPKFIDTLAGGYRDLATASWQGRHYDAAAEPARQAASLLETLAGKRPETPHYTQELCRCLSLLGLIQRDRDELPAGQATLQRAAALGEELATRYPREPQHRLELARTYRNLADVQLKMKERDAAVRSINLATSLQEELAGASAAYAEELRRTRQWWDEVLGLDGTADAERRVSGPRASSTQPVAEATVDPWRGGKEDTQSRDALFSTDRLMQVWSGLSNAFRRVDSSGDSRIAYQQAVAAHEKLIQQYPAAVEYRHRLLDLHLQQGRAMRGAWRIPEAEAAYNSALQTAAGLAIDFPAEQEYRTHVRDILGALKDVREHVAVAEFVALSKSSPEGVAAAVDKVRRMDPAKLPDAPMMRLVYADFLVLAGQGERAVAVIEPIVKQPDELTACFQKSLGIALLQCGRTAEARRAFERALAAYAGKHDAVVGDPNPDVWTAAYFLDWVTADQFVERWRNRATCVGHLGCWPWYYIGLRAELSGQLAPARTAYRKSVEAGRAGNAHFLANWSAYRLHMLEEAGNGQLAKAGLSASQPE